jgi:hypothetical protein
MKRALIAALCAALIAASLPLRAAAQGLAPGQRARAVFLACGFDHQRFCRGVPPGAGRIILCLNEHADEVSQPCFQALTAWGLTAINALKMCLPDAERLCGRAPNPRRTLGCLMENADQLSQPCRDALAAHAFGDGAEPPRR